MSFFKNIFRGKQENTEEIAILTNGKLVDISQVPDQVFSTRMMGDGFAMDTIDGKIFSPVAGKVEVVFQTKHAVAITSNDGREILIHLGVDTVNLDGKGFEVFVQVGQEVKVGDKLVDMDVNFVEKNAKSSMPIVVFTNLNEDEAVEINEGNATVGELNRIKIIKK
ncbi:PTS glucose transporter subunit IIA [Romboutsia weinsteinii]|uniref:PTS glucose transporter subunit IIA n=1 Tax=Romboutsia weinsteinii TaxID=2020949 RepID=A0A371J182_9FIRM|nr:PTS glucose transporter subunit IIA [Romboutsia weinsteinii]RDY26454.1 PTS glucose transporter subunit IIA [Romboutsia weinsteinii]